MSNYLLIDEGRDIQELPPSHLSVYRSNKQTTQVTQVHKIYAPVFRCHASSIGAVSGKCGGKP